MTAALAVVSAHADTVEPRSMPELLQLANAAAKTGFFGAKSPEQALLVMMAGRDLGLSYSQSLRAFHVIDGKPSLSADGMVAACLVRRDVCEFFRTVESTNERATVETKRVGQPAQRYTFSGADAQRAGLATKGTWQKYPSRMLLARAKSALARDVYADLLLGLYDPDELSAEPAAPPERPAARVEMTGEVVDPGLPFVDAMLASLERVGREGTKADLDALGKTIKEEASQQARLQLSAPFAKARDAIKARAKATPPSRPIVAERQPGDDADDVEAAEAERALGGAS